MNQHDLDLDNYNLEDILNLFKVSYDFGKVDLKRAYKAVLMAHPDKSNLDAKYFHFYVAAYKILSNVYHFRHRKQQSTEYDKTELTEEHTIILDNLNKGKFNDWFNDMFKKVKIFDNEQDYGYERWLKSNKDIFDTTNVSKNDVEKVFMKRKQECRDLVIINDLEELGGRNGYLLDRTRPTDYSSEIFSKLKYDDVKKTLIETVIPVTKTDYDDIKKFKNADECRKYRNRITVSSLDQAKMLLTAKKKKAHKIDMERAYYIYKQEEKMEEANEKWWSQIKLLTNK